MDHLKPEEDQPNLPTTESILSHKAENESPSKPRVSNFKVKKDFNKELKSK